MTSVHLFNFFFLSIVSLSVHSAVFQSDKAIARFGRNVVFQTELEKLKEDLSSISCLQEKGLIFQFTENSANQFKQKLVLKSNNDFVKQLILIKKAMSFSNDFNTLESDKELEQVLKPCGLSPYDQLSHNQKEIISFEIFLRDRFLSVGSGKTVTNKKLLKTFKNSIEQREPHEWLIP